MALTRKQKIAVIVTGVVTLVVGAVLLIVLLTVGRRKSEEKSKEPPRGASPVPGWYKKGEPTKDCAWVAKHLPRCDAKGEDGTFAYDSCPNAGCPQSESNTDT